MIFPDDGTRRGTRAKICGITHPDDARLAVESGADALGLNFYPNSVRCLDVKRDGAWLRELPPGTCRVAVVVNATRGEIARLFEAGLVDVVQLHGDEDEAFCLALRDEGVPFVKAIRVRDEGVLETAGRYGTPDLLIDAYHPTAYGGTGQPVDWKLAASFASRHPRVILAGGLHPGNVFEAIREVRPYAVDVASGVERAGEARRKDAGKLREFFAAIRAADAENARKLAVIGWKSQPVWSADATRGKKLRVFRVLQRGMAQSWFASCFLGVRHPASDSSIHHMLTRKLPAFCSLLLLAGPVANGLAQGPLLPPMARSASLGQVAQAAPAATATPALVPTTPTNPVNPADATPAPLTDPNTPAPIAPPTLNGTPGAPGAVGAPGVVPPPPVDTAAPAGSVNSGGARAREFQGDDVGQVLRLLARQAKINLIVSPQVTGTINMRLEDVTALQAIEVICQAQGYDITQNKGVYYVKTPAEKAAEATQSDFYTFSYARAAQIVPLLTSQLKSKAAAPAVDERTNTVFYQEAKSNVSAIREFLAQVDKSDPSGDDRSAPGGSEFQPGAKLRHQLGRAWWEVLLRQRPSRYGGSGASEFHAAAVNSTR